MFTVELPREMRENKLFYTSKYGKDRKEFLEAAFLKGKREIPLKYGKDRISFLEAPAIKGKREIPQKYGKDRKN